MNEVDRALREANGSADDSEVLPHNESLGCAGNVDPARCYRNSILAGLIDGLNTMTGASRFLPSIGSLMQSEGLPFAVGEYEITPVAVETIGGMVSAPRAAVGIARGATALGRRLINRLFRRKCFVAGTPIRLATRSIAIESVRPGMVVRTLTEASALALGSLAWVSEAGAVPVDDRAPALVSVVAAPSASGSTPVECPQPDETVWVLDHDYLVWEPMLAASLEAGRQFVTREGELHERSDQGRCLRSQRGVKDVKRATDVHVLGRAVGSPESDALVLELGSTPRLLRLRDVDPGVDFALDGRIYRRAASRMMLVVVPTGETLHRVVETFENTTALISVLRLTNGERNWSVEGTPEHPFFSVDSGSWVEMGELQRGTTLATTDGNVRVVDVVTGQRTESVYNFEVSGAHTYLVGDALESGGEAVLVHNECRLPRYNGPKPTYHENGPHLPGRRGSGRHKDRLPSDAEEVYRHAVPNSATAPRSWWGWNSQGRVYRYSSADDGTAHFSGVFDLVHGRPRPANLDPYGAGRLWELLRRNRQ